MQKIIARHYQRYLELAGHITQELIGSVLVPAGAYSYTPQLSEEGWRGCASFFADSENTCMQLIERLKPKFNTIGFDLDYRGELACSLTDFIENPN